MELTLYKAKLRELVKKRNGYLLLAIMSILLNLALVGYQYTTFGHERIILVPPQIKKPFWLDGQHVSESYLAEMARFFVYSRLNVTSSNIDEQHEQFLKYVVPDFYSQIKSRLLSEAERIKSFHITMAFYPIDIKVDKDNWLVRLIGELHSTIGDEKQSIQRITYQIGFSYHFGRLMIKSFEEVNK